MRVLIIAEHDSKTVKLGSLSAVGFANCIAAETDGEVEILALGADLGQVSEHAADYAPVLVADAGALGKPVADRYAKVIAQVAKDRAANLVVAASTTFAKDIVARAAGLLGGAMASDVVGHEFQDGTLLVKRPMFAGAVTATVVLNGEPKIMTIRPSAYLPADPKDTSCAVTQVTVDEASLPHEIEVLGLESKASSRPDVTEARIVVSGGRAIRNAEDFAKLVGGLADRLGGAAGSTRALVDARIVPHALQIGQTGKIVAPELYIALGISGSVQHLAGMKDSKVIVAVNTDPDAPIFEVADYGLVGDLYDVVPQMIAKLNAG